MPFENVGGQSIGRGNFAKPVSPRTKSRPKDRGAFTKQETDGIQDPAGLKAILSGKRKREGISGIAAFIEDKLPEMSIGLDTAEESIELDAGQEDLEEVKRLIADKKFVDAIDLLSIPYPDLRIICYYLDLKLHDVRSTTFFELRLISELVMEASTAYMKSIGYVCAGELNFSPEGKIIPVRTTNWTIKHQEINFMIEGFRFYEKSSTDKVILNFFQNETGAGITVYHKDIQKAKEIANDIESFAKEQNCLKGAKLRDVDLMRASFIDVSIPEEFDWENYYYDDSIKRLFDLEIFGFLRESKRYNAVGIKKRGCLLVGAPGTGKTTLGKIICHYATDYSLIWVTPDIIRSNAGYNQESIPLLYRLASYISPVAIFLEDLDLFAEDRDSPVDSLRLGTLMNVLDGINSIENAITIATTNRIDLVEKAISNRPGRFDRVVNIPSMNEGLRRKMLENRLKTFEVSSSTLSYIVGETDGWSGAEMQEFVVTLNLWFIDQENKAENSPVTKKVTMEIVKEALSTMRSYGIKGEKKNRVGFEGLE